MKTRKTSAHFLKLGAKKLWLDYDEEADVLYVSFRRPQKATNSRMGDDLIYHYRDGELVVRHRDFDRQRLLRRSAPRNDLLSVIASAAKQSRRANDSSPVKTFVVIY